MTSTQTLKYEDHDAAGWTYHRNGVSGVGFYATVEDGALRVAWCVYDEATDDESYPVAATIPLPVLAGFVHMDAVGETHERGRGQSIIHARHVAEVADGRPVLHVFDLADYYKGKIGLAGRVVVVSDLIEGEDPRVAAFMLAEVLAGDASTTLQGDNLHGDAVRVARSVKETQGR